MMELYNYDFSEFSEDDINEYGYFGYPRIDDYWNEEGRHPFFIRVDGKLAGLVSKVHKIRLKNFGYTGGGIATWTTFSEFIYDMFNDCTANLRVHNLIGATQLDTIRVELQKTL
jgi:hypothetical protein